MPVHEFLSVLAEDAALVIATATAQVAPPMETFEVLGRNAGLHASANGKVLLAFAPRPSRDAMLMRLPLPAITPNAIVERPQLRVEIDTVRSQGWAGSDGELDLNQASLAALRPLPRHAALGLAFARGSRRRERLLGLLGTTATGLATTFLR